jgi:hypothetical protein
VLTAQRPAPAVVSRQRAVAETAESAAPRFLGVLSVILPACFLLQAVASRASYRYPLVPVVVWLGVLAAAGWLVPRACARGLSRAEAVAAVAVAVTAVAAIGADHRAPATPVQLTWAVLGTVWLLALAAVSRHAWLWVPGAAAIFGMNTVLVLRYFGGSPAGLSRVAAGGYVALVVPAIFAALRPMLRTHAAIALHRSELASQVTAKRAAVAAIQADRRDRLALLEAEALPLLAGIAGGTLDPADRTVRERCGRHAAALRAALADRPPQAAALLDALAPVLGAARSRGLAVSVQVIGDPGTPGPAVTQAVLGTVGMVLDSLPEQPVTLTLLAGEHGTELYLTFSRGGGEWDLAGAAHGVPPGQAWSAMADVEDNGAGCLHLCWRGASCGM